ncbi:unnamed protein product [Clonostachys chloroleuca]|uniref:Uncharacterized protein n=1 Tax=Clonostachys chloroleuca TaxID=1926264 RepID=A0AA35Q3W4_9HYPO|nr:unnamed protein product [Clonostachys chloroleuca]
MVLTLVLQDVHAAVNLQAPPVQHGSTSKSLNDALHYAICGHTQILERILMNLYAPEQLSEDCARRSLFNSCLQDLDGWFQTLPAELKLKEDGGLQNRCPQAYTLLMIHKTSYILVAKPFLSTSNQQIKL